MYGVEKRFKMQLFLGLKGSPLVGGTILNFVTPDLVRVCGFSEHSCEVGLHLAEH